MELDDPRIPADVRVKARKLARERIDEARGRVYAKAQRMTPKKAAKLTAEQESRAVERARQRLAWQKKMQTTPEPTFNLPAQAVPPGVKQGASESTYYAENTPENRVRFTPKRGLVELPFGLKEGVRQDLIERHGIPDDQADALASNAVDRWAQLVHQAPSVDVPQPSIPVTDQPQFLVHPFSEVHYPAEDMAQGMGGVGETDWGTMTSVDPLLAYADSDGFVTSKMMSTAQDEWRNKLDGRLVLKGNSYSPYVNAANWERTGRVAPLGSDQPAGGSLDAKDQLVPLTPSDPTTREPLTATPVDVAKAAVAAAKVEAGGLPVIPLVIGAGVLIYILGKGKRR